MLGSTVHRRNVGNPQAGTVMQLVSTTSRPGVSAPSRASLRGRHEYVLEHHASGVSRMVVLALAGLLCLSSCNGNSDGPQRLVAVLVAHVSVFTTTANL